MCVAVAIIMQLVREQTHTHTHADMQMDTNAVGGAASKADAVLVLHGFFFRFRST